MKNNFLVLLSAIYLMLVSIGVSLAEKRVALVIGNSKYTAVPALTNPKNDANAIALALAKLGFDVIKGLDLDERQSLKIFNKFRRKVTTADVALFFYAGHGLQVGGSNYLIPIDASLESELDLQAQAMRLEIILNMMEHPDRTSIVLLDACRDNPLARQLSRSMGTRSSSVGRGLARVESGLGTYIGFSTEPGNVALDGEGSHSPFAQALLNNINRENLDIESIMRLVRQEVYDKTNGNQLPWGNSSLIGNGFTFKASETKQAKNSQSTPAPAALLVPPPKSNNSAAEISYWDTIKSLENKQYFESYIENFPNGIYTSLAKLMIAELDKMAAVRKIEIQETAKPDEVEKPKAEPKEEELVVAKLETQDQPKDESSVTKLTEKIEPVVTKDIIKNVQKELNRIGCNVGRADGLWGKASKRALRKYADQTNVKLASFDPSVSLLDELKLKPANICIHECSSGFKSVNGKCIAIIKEPAPKKPSVKTATRQKSKKTKKVIKKTISRPVTRTKPKKKLSSGKFRYKCYSYSGNVDIFVLTPSQAHRMHQQDYDTCKRL